MTLADMQKYAEFEEEFWELVNKHFIGATAGKMPAHVDACVVIQVALGRLLAWRLGAPGGDAEFARDMDVVKQTIENSARATLKLADEIGLNMKSTRLQ